MSIGGKGIELIIKINGKSAHYNRRESQERVRIGYKQRDGTGSVDTCPGA